VAEIRKAKELNIPIIRRSVILSLTLKAKDNAWEEQAERHHGSHVIRYSRILRTMTQALSAGQNW